VPHPLGLITLLTDFGESDWFVASMKGVILSINPQATVVDLTHQVDAHAVEDGAFLWKSCYRYFPTGTIHVAVVDPGVGGERRPLIASGSRGFFLAPDNGLLTHVLADEGDIEVREIENRHYRLESEGRTFDGRDVFAPAAAWLTKNQTFASFGPVVSSYKTFPMRAPRWERSALHGEVLYIDRFGNLITNLTIQHVREWREVTKRPHPTIRLAGHLIEGLVGSYSEGEDLNPRALINSNGQVEIFLKESSAAVRLRVGRHEAVSLT
jgi:S-adenosylmethionine hydrolase